MKKLYKITVVIIIACLVFTGCVKKKTEYVETSVKKNSVVYCIGEIPESLIAAQKRNDKTNEILSALFLGLVYEDAKTREIKPGLAEKWEISKDKTQYTFYIRDNAKWSNGEKITSQDFYDFFKVLLSQRINNIYNYDLRYIYGEEAYNSGKTSFDNVAINVVDNSTLRIRLNSPCDYFLSILCEPQFFLRELNENTNNWKENYLKIKYSGPFKISYISKDMISLKKNNNYFMKDSVKSNELKLKFYSEGENISAYSAADFDSNGIDIFSHPPISEIDRLKKNNHVKVFNTLNIGAVYFNMKKPSDVNFRKAINLLTSRNELTKSILSGVILPIYNFVPASVKENYVTSNIFSEAIPSEGVKALKESQYVSDNKIVFVYEENSFNREICKSYIESINKKIKTIDKSKKINFELKGYNKNKLYDILKNGDYDMFLGEYNISFNNPMSFLEMFYSKSPFNINGYSSIAYDDSIYSLTNLSNLNKNNQYYCNIVKQLTTDLPVIPLYVKNNMVCMSPIVSELNENSYGEVDISSIK